MNNDVFNEILRDNAAYISAIANTYQKNKSRFFGKCKLSKDEIEQNIIIGLWKALPKYNPKGGMSIKSFIWQSAHWELNREYSQINKKMPNIKCDSVNIDYSTDILDCLNSLPEKYSEILKKYYIEGKTLQEIGNEIGRTSEYVRVTKEKAIKLFKRKWGEL